LPLATRHFSLALITSLLLLAAFLRLHRLSNLPPGWRDDEVVETAVHAQLVLNGGFPLYFPQAEGHEPLYHYLSALMIALGGRSLFTVRLLSAFFGLVSLAALYRFARRRFGERVALLAAAALAVSFWGLMYGRFKLRHVSEVGLMLLAFDFFTPHPPTTGASPEHKQRVQERGRWALAGIYLAACLYTYFAARAVPLILLAFALYLALFHRTKFRQHGRGFAITLVVAAVLAAPLFWAIASTPGGEDRLSVVGKPLFDLLQGRPQYAIRNTVETFGMFLFTGDPEFLYNIPGRPVFDWLGAVLFAAGVVLSLRRWRQPRYAFLLIWLLGGLAPAFLSVPSASLGHTIAAQPVVYLFPAIAIEALIQHEGTRAQRHKELLSELGWVVAGLFLILTSWRDLRDYFVVWPALPEVRDLYRADLREAAAELRASPRPGPLALASRNLHQADVTALQLELQLSPDSLPRLFNPERAWLFPNDNAAAILRESAPLGNAFGERGLDGAYALRSTLYSARGYQPAVEVSATFRNGWSCLGYTLAGYPDALHPQLTVYWRIGENFIPPPARPIELLSGTSIPLRIFSHVLWPDGTALTGDDRLDVDPATLRPGDEFLQVFRFILPADLPPGRYPVEIGLYNPVSGERLPLTTGEDHLFLITLVP
jgi:4-amino-4-deoxy-L-arabinose transferase-like glycosyltransferase